MHRCRKKSEREGRFGGCEKSGGDRVVIVPGGPVGVDRVVDERRVVTEFGMIV